MPALTADEIADFLLTRGVLMRVATVDREGDPHVTPIWFLFEDGRIWFTPREQSAWLQHIRAHPRIAVTIDEEAAPYRKVTVEGPAEIVHDLGNDDAWRDRYRRITERYTTPDGGEAYITDTIDQPRALMSLRLDACDVTTWRMPRRGEAATGIWHRRYYTEGSKYAREADRPS
jgi:PPOX class probable F420-dependent enzyme